MRIQCPSCQTRHDVSGRPAGTAVTCQCGETWRFPQPARTLLSVQCPGCGAAADPGAGRCQYCDTTLKSVCCPNCYTLMTAGDRHCTGCGTRVAAPATFVHRDGAVTLPCPRCSTALTANLVDKQIFDRCDYCGGIWAHHLAIDGILSHKRGRNSVQQWLTALPTPTLPGSDGGVQLPCPDCEGPMHQYRLPKNKRVAIDVCGDHGIWFDFREIKTLVGSRARRPGSRSRRYNPVRNRSQFASFLQQPDDWWPWEALEEILDFLDDLFE